MLSPALALITLLACTPEASDPAATDLPLAQRPTASFHFDGLATQVWSASPAPPLALTATDGTAMELVSMSGDALVDDPLAWTQLHLTFKNPEARVLEGRFQVQLPEGADIARFAMKVGGDWQEGEMVERQRARQVYEDFLHRRQDPALLEQEAGDLFSARVFPIQAKGTVDLIISWSQAMVAGEGGYRLPLRGLPKLGRLDLTAQVVRATDDGGTQRETIERHEQDTAPTEDFEVPGAVVGDRLGVRSGSLVVARVRPRIAAEPEPVDSLFVLVDSSASRAFDFDQDIDTVGALIAALAAGAGPDTPVGVATYDQAVTPIFEGRAGDFGAADLERMKELLPLGASDPAGALSWLALHQRGGAPLHRRVLVVTDGIATAGAAETVDLRAAAAALREAEVERLDVLSNGGLTDLAAQRGLTNAGLPHDGMVIDGRIGPAAIAARLEGATRSDLEVKVEGAEWVWPERLDAIQPGDEVLITASVPTGQPVRITVGGVPFEGALTESEAPLVARAAAAARIDRLVHLRDTLYAKDPDMREVLQRQATQLSLEQRVLSPWTALLVLETSWDYARYGIGQTGLATIMSVGPEGLAVVERERRVSRDLQHLGYLEDGLISGTESRGADGFGLGRAGTRTRSVPDDLPWTGAKTDLADQDWTVAEQTPKASKAMEHKDFGEASGSAGLDLAGSAEDPGPALNREELDLDLDDNVASGPLARPDAAAGRRPSKPSTRTMASRRRVAWTGTYAEVQARLADHDAAGALRIAKDWRASAPGEVLAHLALGQAFSASGQLGQAARAYGSLIDLFPSRADLRRAAGNQLEALGDPASLALAIDTYRKAVIERPDHPTGRRQLAFALARTGEFSEAFEVILAAWNTGFRWNYEGGIRPVLQEDIATLGAVLAAAEPGRTTEIEATLAQLGLALDRAPSTRFLLTWETDANDVDLHVHDGSGNESWFAHKALPTGGALHRGVFDGYGPECFTIHGKATAWPYSFEAHYYRRGPMGYGIGKLQIIEHDGHGGLRFDERPYVVMNDDAWVGIGSMEAPLGANEQTL